MNKVFVIIAILSSHFVFAQRPSPGPKQDKPICVKGATLHIGNGQVLQNADILFDNGKITFVGPNANAANAQIIDASGKHVYPGFILLNSILGLIEIDAVKATEDFTEIEEYHPEVRSLVSFNTDSKIIPTVRKNGVLFVQSTLKSSTIWGTSSIMNLDAWNWEDAAVKVDNGVHIDWPSLSNPNWRRGQNDRDKSISDDILKLKDLIDRAYVYTLNAKEKDFKLEALKSIFTGEKTVYVTVQDVYEAKQVLDYFEKYAGLKLVFNTSSDLTGLANELNKRGVAVVLSRIHRLPTSPESDVSEAYALPKKYFDAKILFSIDYEGDMEAMGSRNLPFLAGTAVGYGLPYEEAVKSLSLNAAKIVGIDANYGSLEVGKSASFFISDGDALDMKSNNVIYAFIDGRMLHLTSHQEELQKMYLDKYKQENKLKD